MLCKEHDHLRYIRTIWTSICFGSDTCAYLIVVIDKWNCLALLKTSRYAHCYLHFSKFWVRTHNSCLIAPISLLAKSLDLPFCVSTNWPIKSQRVGTVPNMCVLWLLCFLQIVESVDLQNLVCSQAGKSQYTFCTQCSACVILPFFRFDKVGEAV